MKFRVHFIATLRDSIIVDAKNEKEAEEKADSEIYSMKVADLTERNIESHEIEWAEKK